MIAHIERETRAPGIASFEPDHYAVNLVRRAVTNNQDVLLSANGLGTILLLPARGGYWPHVADMRAFCTLAAAHVQVRTVAPNDPLRPLPSNAGRPIRELLWEAAFHASDGRLMAGCYRDDVVELLQWPNMTRLPVTPNSIRMAALFARQPTSLTIARSLLKVEFSELSRFYSAARAAGFAHAVNRKTAEPELAPHRSQGLLSALFQRITRL